MLKQDIEHKLMHHEENYCGLHGNKTRYQALYIFKKLLLESKCQIQSRNLGSKLSEMLNIINSSSKTKTFKPYYT